MSGGLRRSGTSAPPGEARGPSSVCRTCGFEAGAPVLLSPLRPPLLEGGLVVVGPSNTYKWD